MILYHLMPAEMPAGITSNIVHEIFLNPEHLVLMDNHSLKSESNSCVKDVYLSLHWSLISSEFGLNRVHRNHHADTVTWREEFSLFVICKPKLKRRRKLISFTGNLHYLVHQKEFWKLVDLSIHPSENLRKTLQLPCYIVPKVLSFFSLIFY